MNNPYTKLLDSKRGRKSSSEDRSLILESESDRSRVVFSAPFRRLQQKAQVFSLESNAAVRSRLTHSLEVAQIGRFLADQIVEALIKDDLIGDKEARSFITFVEVACLMHDLGNPPFGHFGEAAISEWFKDKGRGLILEATGINPPGDGKYEDIENLLADFIEFDGNCQGLRIAALLQWKDDELGLNLTYTSLASYLKYIRAPMFDSSSKKDIQFCKKAGFFSTEKLLVNKIWNHFGYKENKPQRFPLAYVMEAADDIAYCISDLEDSIEKELLSPKDVFPQLLSDWEQQINLIPTTDGLDAAKITAMLTTAKNSTKNNSATFTDFRTTFSKLLTEIACKNYCINHSNILDGTSASLIAKNTPEGCILDILKDFCRTKVYQHASVQRTELAGLTAIRGLLDHFGILLRCRLPRFQAALNNKNHCPIGEKIIFEKKLLSLFPEKHLLAYKHGYENIDILLTPLEQRLIEWNARAHLITDFISGMTDDYALATFQTLSGIKVD